MNTDNQLVMAVQAKIYSCHVLWLFLVTMNNREMDCHKSATFIAQSVADCQVSTAA